MTVGGQPIEGKRPRDRPRQVPERIMKKTRPISGVKTARPEGFAFLAIVHDLSPPELPLFDRTRDLDDF